MIMRILFAFGDPGSGYSGGDLLVYRLANHLVKDHQVDFIRLSNWRQAIASRINIDSPGITHRKNSLTQRVYESINRNRSLKAVADRLSLTPSQDDIWPLDPRIRTTLYDGKRPVATQFDHAVATNWTTAYFVHDSIRASKKHYLIQNFEDSQLYSSDWASFVGPAYMLDLHKIVVSDALKSRFESDRPSLVYPGVDSEQFSEAIPNRRRPLHSLIMPLKAAPYKGAEIGLEAAKLARSLHSDTTLIAFGNKYSTRLIDYRPASWCHISHNPLTRELVGLYNSARYLLFPSRLEGFPVVPLEAMACGCVVISTPNPGVNSYLVDGENGFVSRGFDAPSFHDAIERGFSEKERINEIIASAKETTLKYTWIRTYDMFRSALGLVSSRA